MFWKREQKGQIADDDAPASSGIISPGIANVLDWSKDPTCIYLLQMISFEWLLFLTCHVTQKSCVMDR